MISSQMSALLPSLAGLGRRAGRLPRLRGWESLLVWFSLLALWYLATLGQDASANPLLPAPNVVAWALWASLPELWVSSLSSAKILLPGYFLAIALAVPAGLVVGTYVGLQRAFLPFARAAAPVPPTVYIPYAIAVLPTFHLSAVFVVFIGAFWPIFHNTALGAGSVPGLWRDSARTLELARLEYLYRVAFPASLPQIFAGMGVGLVFSFILLTVAELFGAAEGLGRFVHIHADYANYPQMVAGILYTGFVAAVSMAGLEWIRHRVLFWNK
ncbi:ABC transporter permease, partial [Ectothiorhodospira lacustris]|uniref:ABC transporter permease n=1 Tax=Ectothiorhodospira lacustris TaxID=2899127 RepID=UPI001EE8D542